MAVDLTAKKSDAVTKFRAIAEEGMELALKVQELNAYLTDNGFLTGGTSPIVDADFVGENAYLDAATFNAGVSALNTITLSNPNKTALRKATRTPVLVD